MRSADPYLAEREMKMRVDEELRRSQVRGLVGPAAGRRPWAIGRHGQDLLCELGYLLVALGARLESYALGQEA